MQEITIGPNQAGQRFDKFLHKYLPNATSSFLYKMLRKKNITLNGKKAEGKELLVEGDVVQSFFSEETFLKFSGKGSDVPDGRQLFNNAYNSLTGIEVLYEDTDRILLNKPAGILTQKAKESDLSLNEWLIGYLLATGRLTDEDYKTFKPSVCNRLDRNTSGIVICGKSLAGEQKLSEMIRTRAIGKFYRTICVGEIHGRLTLEGHLHKDNRTNKVTVRNRLENDAGDIKTVCVPISANGKYTLLEVELITGKPHQIRAHLASIGHPLIGDAKYGNEMVNARLKEKYGLQNQLLHAYRVVFPDGPEVTAPCPDQFKTISDSLFGTGAASSL